MSVTICTLLDRAKYKTCHRHNFCQLSSNWWSCVHFVIVFVWNTCKEWIMLTNVSHLNSTVVHYSVLALFSQGVSHLDYLLSSCHEQTEGPTVIWQFHCSCPGLLSRLESLEWNHNTGEIILLSLFIKWRRSLTLIPSFVTKQSLKLKHFDYMVFCFCSVLNKLLMQRKFLTLNTKCCLMNAGFTAVISNQSCTTHSSSLFFE